MCFCDGDCGTDVEFVGWGHQTLVEPGSEVAEGIHGYDFGGVAPRWEGTDVGGWFGVGEVWFVFEV